MSCVALFLRTSPSAFFCLAAAFFDVVAVPRFPRGSMFEERILPRKQNDGGFCEGHEEPLSLGEPRGSRKNASGTLTRILYQISFCRKEIPFPPTAQLLLVFLPHSRSTPSSYMLARDRSKQTASARRRKSLCRVTMDRGKLLLRMSGTTQDKPLSPCHLRSQKDGTMDRGKLLPQMSSTTQDKPLSPCNLRSQRDGTSKPISTASFAAASALVLPCISKRRRAESKDRGGPRSRRSRGGGRRSNIFRIHVTRESVT